MARLENYAPDRPLILLTDYPPDFGGGGIVNVRSVLDPEARSRVLWATLEPAPPSGAPAEPGAPAVYLKGGPGAAPRASRSVGADSTILCRRLADELIELARERRARGYWVVMHGAAVPIAAHLVRRGGLPLVASVHDDPVAHALGSRRYLVLAPLIARDFARTLRGAAGVEVVSPGMLERYRRLYGVEGKLGNRGIAPFEAAPAPYDKGEGVLRIGVLGSTYGYGPLPALARAVAGAAEGLGIRGEVVVVGRGYADRLRAEFGGRIGVVGVGQVCEEEAVATVRACFLNYVSYPFGRRKQIFRRTSFPIKLVSYISAGRPLLLHMPADSSAAGLAEIPGLAYLWASNDPAEGAAILRRAWESPTTSGDARAGLEEVRRRHFDLETIRSSLFGMLNDAVGPLPASRTPGPESPDPR